MGECTPEFWTLKEIKDCLEKGWNGNKKIVIPMFQRGKRWNKEKEETFIDSLKKKYPIGTLLFYKTTINNQEIYTLIDGLQRGTTIKKYLSAPTKFFKIKQLPVDELNKLYKIVLDDENQSEKEVINNIISEYVSSLPNFDNFELMDLFEKIVEVYPEVDNSQQRKAFKEVLKPLFKEIKEDYDALCKISIPAIVYTGPESTLPEIFERINSKGVALTEYEIYAASWPGQKFFVNNSVIVDKVLSKYDMLNDNDYDLSGYNRDNMRKTRLLNAFEYTFGLSKFLSEKYECLSFYKNQKDDETNPIAFQLLNACFNSSHSQIKDVHNIILRFSANIELLEDALLSSIEFVINCIEPIVKFKGNTRNNKAKILHSQYQIMSLISYVFRRKYSIVDDTIKINSEWKNVENKFKESLWKYYVFDVLSKYWGEGGTVKIHSANNEDRYLKDISYGQFRSAFDTYVEQCFSRREAKQVPNPIDKDYVILNTIYVQSFSAMQQLSLNKFDIEHIATKEQMKKIIDITKSLGLPISHIGNLCYLPEFENRSKGAKNFYQDNGYLKNMSLDEIESKYSFTTGSDLEWMDFEFTDKDNEVFEELYIEFLTNRTKVLKDKFMQSLGYNNSDIEEDDTNNNDSPNKFDNKYFQFTKIGQLVRQCMEYLMNQNLLTTNDIYNLSDKNYCAKNLGCSYSVLVDSVEKTIDGFGKNRYWKEPVKYNNINYYVCSQWYEDDRKLFVPWFKSKINM